MYGCTPPPPLPRQKANFKIGLGLKWHRPLDFHLLLHLLYAPFAFLAPFSFAGHLLSFISMGEVFGKVSNSQSQKTVNTWNIFSNMLWPVMHCPAPSLPSHPKSPRQLHVISQGKVMHSYSDNRNLDVATHSTVIQFTKKLCYIVYRVCTGSWILEKKVLKLAQQFSRPRKSLENGYKVYKNGKSLFLIFFQSYNKCYFTTSALWEPFFLFWSNPTQSCPHKYICSPSWKKLCSCIF